MKPLRLKALLMLVMLVFSSLVYAQSTRLKGVVRDSSGEPLVGVAVAVKGTSVGTITDINGNFYMSGEFNDETVVVFSFVGMQTQEIKIGKMREFEII